MSFERLFLFFPDVLFAAVFLFLPFLPEPSIESLITCFACVTPKFLFCPLSVSKLTAIPALAAVLPAALRPSSTMGTFVIWSPLAFTWGAIDLYEVPKKLPSPLPVCKPEPGPPLRRTKSLSRKRDVILIKQVFIMHHA